MALEYELTEEQVLSLPEQLRVVYRIQEARDRGDEAAVMEWQKKLAPPAGTLMVAKRNLGADWVRDQGYDTRHADEQYGANWLDE